MPVTLHPLAEKLKSLFVREDAVLREALQALPPEELANVVNGLGPRERQRVFRLLSDEKFGHALRHLSPHVRTVVAARLSAERTSALMAHLESDEIADLIPALDRRTRERVIAALKKSDPKKVLPLLGFESETAGGLMKSEVLRIESGQTVEDVRKLIGGMLNHHKATTLYVADPDGVLAGTVSLVRFATSPPTALIRDIMHDRPVSVPVTMPQEDVLRVFSERDVLELPVVDSRGRLLGVITADDVFDVLKREMAEDLSRFSGVSEDERITDPASLAVRRRLPWLILNLGTAILAAWVVTWFQPTISRFVILAAMMPIVAGMGGNAVTQTLGVSIRAIALGELHTWNTWKIIGRQMLAGGVNGLVTGLIMGVIAWAWTRNLELAGVLILAMAINLFIAGLGGVAIPVVMKRLRIDPALASTVFATTLTDVVGFFTFLGLATLLL